MGQNLQHYYVFVFKNANPWGRQKELGVGSLSC